MKMSDERDVCRAKRIARSLIDMADKYESKCDSDACILVYGILRDCGYRIIRSVGVDKFKHLNCDRWNGYHG